MDSLRPFPIAGVLFDMDGLLLDTERLGLTLWEQAAKDFDLPFSREIYQLMIGRTVRDTLAMLRRHYPAETPVEDFVTHANELYRERILAGPMPIKPGFPETLQWLKDQGLPLAVATSTGLEKALRKLAGVELTGFFDVVVGGDQVEHGKPAPDIYLRAARQLGIDPSRCLAFEDSEPGLQAASTAGCVTVWIPDLYPPTALMREISHARLDSAEEVPHLFDAGLAQIVSVVKET